MLHLVYVMRPTAHARANLRAMWSWIHDRHGWFYGGLDMVKDVRWFVRTIGPEVHALEHFVSFEDEAAWGEYRRVLAVRAKDQEWEKRRVEQDLWWEILEAKILTDPPQLNVQ